MGILPVFRRWKELGKVAILLNDVGYSALIDFGCISSRIMWIKFRFSRVKVFVVVGTTPMKKLF